MYVQRVAMDGRRSVASTYNVSLSPTAVSDSGSTLIRFHGRVIFYLFLFFLLLLFFFSISSAVTTKLLTSSMWRYAAVIFSERASSPLNKRSMMIT